MNLAVDACPRTAHDETSLIAERSDELSRGHLSTERLGLRTRVATRRLIQSSLARRGIVNSRFRGQTSTACILIISWFAIILDAR